jgi:integrase/recombinase XerD
MASHARGGPKATHRTEHLDRSGAYAFGRWIARHLEWMRVRGYSERTLRTREPGLVAFARWCEMRGVESVREVTKPILERYQAHLFYHRKPSGKWLTLATQKSRMIPIKTLFSWLTKQNVLLWNPASELVLPRPEVRLPRAVLTEQEAEAVLAQCDLGDPLGLRDRAILELLYATGMRRSEVTHLELSDLDLERTTVRVREGKYRKDRLLPLGERAAAFLAKYIDEARPRLATDAKEMTVFLTHLGTPIEPPYLTHRVAEIVDAADVGKRGACHLFRHTMATVMLERGADIRFIQQMLGHTHQETTQIYARVSMRTLAAVHSATHPTAKLARTAGHGGASVDGAPSLAASDRAALLEDELARDDAGDEDLDGDA